MVKAVIFMCFLSNGFCHSTEAMVEPKACRAGEYRAVIKDGGKSEHVRAGINCK